MRVTYSKRAVAAQALQSFLDSGQMCKKELATVPPCKYCGIVPKQYRRFDDGTVQCMDSAQCYANEAAAKCSP